MGCPSGYGKASGKGWSGDHGAIDWGFDGKGGGADLGGGKGAGFGPYSPSQGAGTRPACITPGCNKPTWNGQPGTKCTRTCGQGGHRAQGGGFAQYSPSTGSVPTCLSGCGKPTWNGQPNEYCSKACRNAARGAKGTSTSGALCCRIGCFKPSFNGNPGQYCSKSCRDRASQGKGGKGGKGVPQCSLPGCKFPTFDRKPGGFCSLTCRKKFTWRQKAAGQPTQGQGSGSSQKLVKIFDKHTLAAFQKLLDVTKLDGPHNWTRDRGCKIHGQNSCDPINCAAKNKAPVPTGYKLVSVEHNDNPALMHAYFRNKAFFAAGRKLVLVSSKPPFDTLGLKVKGPALKADCNEWYVFHGAPRAAIESICKTNFNIQSAGTGATATISKGKRPLYGWGCYFAERITKADEYAKQIHPNSSHFAVLVCRVTGGNVHTTTDDGIPEPALLHKLKTQNYHSVIGDRVSQGKPYNEIVIYDSSQIFPEFVVTYKRL